MKILKITFALMFVTGIMGISQAFACKVPTANSQNAVQSNAPAKAVASEISLRETLDSPSLAVYSRRDLSGRYASFATVTYFDPTANRTMHGTCVGVVTFDGRGRFTDREVHSYDGTIVRDEFTGTYTVNADGTGVMHFIGENETYDYQFVISNEGKEITFLVTFPEDTPGVVSQGTLKKQ